jgi:hypothetical protein
LAGGAGRGFSHRKKALKKQFGICFTQPRSWRFWRFFCFGLPLIWELQDFALRFL